MAPERAACPSCGAATKPGDPWCTLCFADLRPQVVPPPPRPVAPEPRSAPVAARSGPALNPITALSTGVVSTQPLAADAATPPEIRSMTCPTCGDAMPITADACPSCGESPFVHLRDTAKMSLKLPLLGDLMRFDRGMRYTVALAVALLVASILVGIIYGLSAVL